MRGPANLFSRLENINYLGIIEIDIEDDELCVGTIRREDMLLMPVIQDGKGEEVDISSNNFRESPRLEPKIDESGSECSKKIEGPTFQNYSFEVSKEGYPSCKSEIANDISKFAGDDGELLNTRMNNEELNYRDCLGHSKRRSENHNQRMKTLVQK